MIERVVGWIVRTHDGVRERFWRVGVARREDAESLAAEAADAGSQAISPVTVARKHSGWRMTQGVASEIPKSKTPSGKRLM